MLPESAWLAAQRGRPELLAAAFPAVGRKVGRGPLHAPTGSNGERTSWSEGSDEAQHAVSQGPDERNLVAGWGVDEVARGVLVAGLVGVLSGDEFVAALGGVYRYGDAGEKRAVLKALGVREVAEALGDRGVPLVADAIRTNDQRLLAAALGPYATRYLEAAGFRQAVLKCVFAGVPLSAVDGLPARSDDELIRMMTDFAAERTAAGRDVPADLQPYLRTA
ncbi:EboA domain-containing protein [Kribbella sp. NBC_01245]